MSKTVRYAQNGKGSKPRPFTDKKKYADNWDLIFGDKSQDKKLPNQPTKGIVTDGSNNSKIQQTSFKFFVD